jgi:hypothetical protein
MHAWDRAAWYYLLCPGETVLTCNLHTNRLKCSGVFTCCLHVGKIGLSFLTKTPISDAIRADFLGSIGLLKPYCIYVMTSLLFILVTKSSSFFPVVGPLGFLIGIDATTNSSVRSSYQSI